MADLNEINEKLDKIIDMIENMPRGGRGGRGGGRPDPVKGDKRTLVPTRVVTMYDDKDRNYLAFHVGEAHKPYWLKWYWWMCDPTERPVRDKAISEAIGMKAKEVPIGDESNRFELAHILSGVSIEQEFDGKYWSVINISRDGDAEKEIADGDLDRDALISQVENKYKIDKRYWKTIRNMKAFTDDEFSDYILDAVREIPMIQEGPMVGLPADKDIRNEAKELAAHLYGFTPDDVKKAFEKAFQSSDLDYLFWPGITNGKQSEPLRYWMLELALSIYAGANAEPF